MIQSLRRIRREVAVAATISALALAPVPAWAAGSNMPWEQPLNQILQSIQGPVAKILAVIIIITTGLTLAFGDTSGGFRRLIQIVFGLQFRFAHFGFHGAGAPLFNGADSVGWRTARGSDSQWHSGGSARSRPAAMARRSLARGHRSGRRGVGGEARSAIRRCRAPASAHLQLFGCLKR
jgi:type IV secretion system protein TrbC